MALTLRQILAPVPDLLYNIKASEVKALEKRMKGRPSIIMSVTPDMREFQLFYRGNRKYYAVPSNRV